MSREIEISNQSAIEHILRHKPQKIRTLHVPKSGSVRVDEIVALAKKAKIPTNPGELKATLAPYEYTELSALIAASQNKKFSLLVGLDHLQDPQNLGAICRSAEGLGVDGVLIPKDRGVLVNAGAYHASVGAVETLPIALVGNLGDSLRKLKDAGYWIVGTTLGGKATSIAEMPTFEKVVLVLGAEWEGLSPSLEKACDWLLQIPLRGKVQSLNVSAAGAILMHQLLQKSTPQTRS